MDKSERARLLAAAIDESEGFAILGQEICEVVRTLLPYESGLRIVAPAHPLLQGEERVVKLDRGHPGAVLNSDGVVEPTPIGTGAVLPPEAHVHETFYWAPNQVSTEAVDAKMTEMCLALRAREEKILFALAERQQHVVFPSYDLERACQPFPRRKGSSQTLTPNVLFISADDATYVRSHYAAEITPAGDPIPMGCFRDVILYISANLAQGSIVACTAGKLWLEVSERIALYSEPFTDGAGRGWVFAEQISATAFAPGGALINMKGS